MNKLLGNNNNNQQWQFISRESRDGHTAKLFHPFCDSRGPTMIVIRSQNRCLFGRFTTNQLKMGVCHLFLHSSFNVVGSRIFFPEKYEDKNN